MNDINFPECLLRRLFVDTQSMVPTIEYIFTVFLKQTYGEDLKSNVINTFLELIKFKKSYISIWLFLITLNREIPIQNMVRSTTNPERFDKYMIYLNNQIVILQNRPFEPDNIEKCIELFVTKCVQTWLSNDKQELDKFPTRPKETRDRKGPKKRKKGTRKKNKKRKRKLTV